MNGVSNMLPFVIGGGILIAIAFLLMIILLTFKLWFKYTYSSIFKGIGDKAFGFMLPVLAG